MKYQELIRVFYRNKEEYEKLYLSRINSESTKVLDFEINGYKVFFCMCPEIYNLSFKIFDWDKKVSKLSRELPGIAFAQFAEKCLIDEILLTNDIEGVYSTRKEIKGVLKSLDENHKNKRFYGLVKKYSMLSGGDISLKSCADIRTIYDELVLPEVVADDIKNKPDGAIFRKEMAEVVNSSQKIIHHGVYPEAKIIDLMEKSLSILNDNEIPNLIRISVFHYLFGFIHPFYDGNGRTSRFISSYLLSRDFEYMIGYRLSYTIKENIKKYYTAFKNCNDIRNRGDLTPFVIMFLEIVCESFVNLYDALEKRYNSLVNCYKQINELEGINEEESEFISILAQAALFSSKGISKKELCECLSISPSTVDKRLDKVRSAGLLVEDKSSREYLYSLNTEKFTD